MQLLLTTLEFCVSLFFSAGIYQSWSQIQSSVTLSQTNQPQQNTQAEIFEFSVKLAATYGAFLQSSSCFWVTSTQCASCRITWSCTTSGLMEQSATPEPVHSEIVYSNLDELCVILVSQSLSCNTLRLTWIWGKQSLLGFIVVQHQTTSAPHHDQRAPTLHSSIKTLRPCFVPAHTELGILCMTPTWRNAPCPITREAPIKLFSPHCQ